MITRAAFFILFWLLVHTLMAQEVATINPVSSPKSIELSECCPEEIFKGSGSLAPELIIINHIEFEGNEATRNHILLRELVFAQGDTLTREELPHILEKSRENLLNTSLFNFVNVSLLFHDMLPIASVKFTFIERWYIWPFPIFEVAERNLNDWVFNPSFHRTNYGAYIVKENFRGRMERVSLLARFGYRQMFNFRYNIPYLNRAQNIGINFNVGYARRNEIDYLTQNNVQLFYSEDESWALQQFYISTGLSYRRGIHVHHNFYAGYNKYSFADSLLVLNPQFSPSNETEAPFFTIGYEFKNDHRDVKAYPLRGYYFDIRIRKEGLGLLPKEKIDLTQLETSVRNFWKLHSRWYFAAGINAKVSTGNYQPYYLQQGLGFKGDIVRGYENFVIDGQHFAVLKSNFKYNLIPSTVTRIGFINNEKFSLIHYALYINFFTDIGYVRDNLFFNQNTFSNSFLQGSGIGFDLVTYYDKVFRTEFSITRHGNAGVYLHLIAPI